MSRIFFIIIFSLFHLSAFASWEDKVQFTNIHSCAESYKEAKNQHFHDVMKFAKIFTGLFVGTCAILSIPFGATPALIGGGAAVATVTAVMSRDHDFYEKMLFSYEHLLRYGWIKDCPTMLKSSNDSNATAFADENKIPKALCRLMRDALKDSGNLNPSAQEYQMMQIKFKKYFEEGAFCPPEPGISPSCRRYGVMRRKEVIETLVQEEVAAHALPAELKVADDTLAWPLHCTEGEEVGQRNRIRSGELGNYEKVHYENVYHFKKFSDQLMKRDGHLKNKMKSFKKRCGGEEKDWNHYEEKIHAWEKSLQANSELDLGRAFALRPTELVDGERVFETENERDGFLKLPEVVGWCKASSDKPWKVTYLRMSQMKLLRMRLMQETGAKTPQVCIAETMLAPKTSDTEIEASGPSGQSVKSD